MASGKNVKAVKGSRSADKSAGQKPKRISGWDFATWRTASDHQMLRSTMIAIYLLDRAPDWDRLVERYDRASRQAPVLRMKVVEGPVPFANPRLVVDEHFDLSFHLRRFNLPKGSTWDDVLEDGRRQGMTDFDRDRSLWRVTVLEGLPDGKAALIFKLHHAIADGQGALQIGASLVDLTQDGEDLGPMPDAPVAGDLSSKRTFGKLMVTDNVRWFAATATEFAKAAPEAAEAALKDPLSAIGKVAEIARSFVKFADLPSAPASPVMVDRSVNFHCTAFTLPFEDIRSAAKASGHTANDVFLASISEGMTRYHRLHDAPVGHLNISTPISTRKAGDDEGNAVGIAHFQLPLGERDSAKLMTHIHKIVKKWRAEPVIGYSFGLGEVSRFLPSEMVISGATSSDLTASNVPGPPVELWMAGAKIEHIVPFPPLIGAAVFIAMLTYNGEACIGISADDAAVDDLDVLMQCLADGFAYVTGKPVAVDGLYATPNAPSKKPTGSRTTPKKAPAKRASAKKAPARQASRKSTAKPRKKAAAS